MAEKGREASARASGPEEIKPALDGKPVARRTKASNGEEWVLRSNPRHLHGACWQVESSKQDWN